MNTLKAPVTQRKVKNALRKAAALNTSYVKHTDTDANVVRFYGPLSLGEAQLKANHLILVGHQAEVIQKPAHIKEA